MCVSSYEMSLTPNMDSYPHRTDKLIRDSLVSRDSGLGEDPSQSDRESITTQVKG